MQILCDTNILVRAIKPDDSRHQVVVGALSVLRARNEELVIVPQNCYEYYVVATRPVEQNGLGLTSRQATADVEEFLAIFRLLRDERTVFRFWKDLVTTHDVVGKQAHDARLVAAMQRHQITNLLTLNGADFQRYSAIQVIDPRDV